MYYFRNSDLYEGSWIYNIPSGHGVYTFAIGGIYTGDFLNGLPHGLGVYECTDPMPLPEKL